MNPSEKFAYIRTHRGKIEKVKDTATQIIDMMSPFVAVQEDDSSPLEVVNGEPTPADMYELHLNRGIELNGDEAHTLALYRSRVLRRQAEMAILGLQASTTALYLGGRSNEAGGVLMPYKDARYATIEAYSAENQSVQLSYVQLNGLDEAGSASTHEITVSDGVLVQSLAIASLNAVARNIKHGVRATEGSIISRCVSALDEKHVTQVLSLLGRTTTEAEVDATLRDIWEVYKLRDDADMMTSLLDDIKVRAMSAQHMREMNGCGGDTTLPNEAKLNEFGHLLGLRGRTAKT